MIQNESTTFALLHRSLKAQLDDYLARGDRKLMLFMHEINAKLFSHPNRVHLRILIHWKIAVTGVTNKRIMKQNTLPLLELLLIAAQEKRLY